MQLFELSKIIFENPAGYDEVTRGAKRSNFFMLNRRFAINHPFQAHVLNHIKINQEEAIDIWQKFLRKQYKKTPYWMYTKGVKKVKEEKEKKINISAAIVEEYARKYTMDLQSVWDALNFFPKEMQKELKEFEKLTK